MVGRPAQPPPAHGTRARYGHRSETCRCEACRQANTRYQAAYRAAAAPPTTAARVVAPVQLEIIPRGGYERIRLPGGQS